MVEWVPQRSPPPKIWGRGEQIEEYHRVEIVQEIWTVDTTSVFHGCSLRSTHHITKVFWIVHCRPPPFFSPYPGV